MSEQVNYVWHDREIRFDSSTNDLKPRKGEILIDELGSIEDTKGNNGERGQLSITNLRLIWTCTKNKKINLSIGYNCIVNITTHQAKSRIRGTTQALFVLTKYNGSRFEFIFTNLVKNTPRLFTTVQAVFRSYETTKLYRDLKLRAAIIRNKDLILLPKEEIINNVKGVWNLSSDQGNLGTFIISNIRVVWFADLAENFNVSIPYMQINKVKVRDSKFGTAFVVETTEASGGYILGFKVDPKNKLEKLFKEISSLHKLYSSNPIFGVEFEVQEEQASLEELTVPKIVEDVEIVEDKISDPLVAYYADGKQKDKDRKIVFNDSLGLAIEEPIEGFGLEDLWNIHKN